VASGMPGNLAAHITRGSWGGKSLDDRCVWRLTTGYTTWMGGLVKGIQRTPNLPKIEIQEAIWRWFLRWKGVLVSTNGLVKGTIDCGRPGQKTESR